MSEVRFDACGVIEDLRRRQSPYWGVHAARYRFAKPHVAGARVLDIACGTGYGLPVLQTNAYSVVGVDVDFDAAQKARAEIGQGPEVVLVADGYCLPFQDGSFNVVTSFETLEHLEERGQFVGELRRVLASKGLCIISTPNANYTRPVNGRPLNPHHVFEYKPEELTAELQKHFSDVRLFGQVLDSRFAISPFLEEQQRLPYTPRALTRLLLWRVINKLPMAVRDHLSYAIWGHPLFPGDSDYDFTPDRVEDAIVLVALCSGSPVNCTT